MSFLRSLILSLLLFTAIHLPAQSLDELFDKVNKQIDLQADEGLFLHLDKSVFQSGEKLWFAGYQLGAGVQDSTGVLYIVLVNDMSQVAVASERFLIEKGVASGSIYIADSLQTGQYSIIAYTDSFFKNPEQHRFFRQAIEVIGTKPMFRVEVANASAVKDSLILTAKVVKSEGGLPKNATVEYFLYADNAEIKKGTARTNMYGEFPITIALAFASSTMEMRGIVTEEKEKVQFKVPVIWPSEDYVVNVIAENNLAIGMPSVIYYRITRTTGRGVAAYLQLLEDTTAIASMQSDVYGMGKLSFIPKAGKQYSIVLRDNRAATVFQAFPSIDSHTNRIAVHPQNANNKDTVILSVDIPGSRDEILTVHTSSDVITQMALKMRTGKGSLALPVTEWPRGMKIVSLFDNNAALQAQTKFLLTPDTSHNVTIQTDSFSYHKRAKVNATVRVTDKEGKPMRGVFSLSAVSSRKLNESFTDIYRYYFIDRLMPYRSSYPSLYYLQEGLYAGYFFNRKYEGNNKTSYAGYAVPDFDGQVLMNNKKIRKPANMIVVGPQLSTFVTNEEGYFKIPSSAFQMNIGERAFVSISSSSPENYSITLNDPEQQLNTLLAKQYFPLPLVMQRDEYSVEQREAIQSSTVKTLQAVVVKSGNNSDRYSVFSGTSGCNDYVCQYGILNCRNHPMAFGRPVEGMRYSDGRGGFVIYHCDENKKENEFIKALKPVYATDIFSAPDLTVDNSLISPDLLTRSTIYWGALLFTNENGEAQVSFYTNDVKGRFTCILQGVTNAGVIHGRTEFTVVE